VGLPGGGNAATFFPISGHSTEGVRNSHYPVEIYGIRISLPQEDIAESVYSLVATDVASLEWLKRGDKVTNILLIRPLSGP
jgi:hypothetical protein